MLTGIIYMRDINVEKMNNSGVKNLDLFLKLCGQEYLKNVVLVTSKWDKVGVDDQVKIENREKQLLDNFWSGMRDHGCGYERYDNTTSCAQRIIKPILSFEPNWLQVQRELGKGKNLNETAAGQVLHQDVAQLVKDYEVRIDGIKEQLSTTHQHSLQKHLKKLKDEYEGKCEILEQQKKELGKDQDILVREAVAKAREDFGAKTVLKKWTDRVDGYRPGDLTTKKVAKYGGITAGVVALSPFVLFGAALLL